MAKKMMAGGSCSGMCCCGDGGKWLGWLVLAAGLLWLLNDYGMAGWWGVSWWTLAALVLGLSWSMKR